MKTQTYFSYCIIDKYDYEKTFFYSCSHKPKKYILAQELNFWGCTMYANKDKAVNSGINNAVAYYSSDELVSIAIKRIELHQFHNGDISIAERIVDYIAL